MTAAAGAAARRGAGLVVLVCFLIAAVEGYDIQAFGVAAPTMVPELGLNPAQMGWAGSAAMIGLVVGALAGGWLADRTGRKPVLIGSVAAFGLFSLATAWSHSYETLLLARFATGLGFGGAMPNLIAVAVEISRPERRAATVAAMFCGMPVGGATAALIARLSGPELEWRAIFLAGGVAPLALVPLLVFLLPETRPEPDATADRSLTRALFGEGRAAATVLVWAAFMLTLVVLYLALNWLPTLVVDKGHPPSEGFAAAMAFNIAGVVGSLLMGAVTDRFGWRWPLALAYVGLATAMAALADADTPMAIFALSAAAGFLVMGAQFSLYAVAPALYPAHLRAAGAGCAVGVGRLGSIFGPLIAGELRNAGATPGQVFLAIAPAGLAAAVILLALARAAKVSPVSGPGANNPSG
ncbi:MAG: 3-(3-hydroxy-phenyl)propionate transporter MhpT [Phenylobacterium sp.]|uniref:3-(3-hydroxy-phenyl)propionate transporter MhpT n=1 Tax=Phenylobacterium sp. TaxID=1871053 RepID=UPI001A602C46|nr:3-(3-hydroxy-phenyl)propionate transporter MhpT [Phenylobacterium sp.]MBL8554054.1 3-(3-hydroxy-phenyl)propionate transporter MhpT [Phenylobacterium sp.]